MSYSAIHASGQHRYWVNMLNMRSPLLRAASPFAFLLLSACGDEPAPVTGEQRQPSTVPDGGSCEEGAHQSCPCPSDPQPGRQYCYQGSWLLCGCSTPVPTNTISNNDGSCLAGRYEGNFFGLYFSSYSPGGTPIPVAGLDITLKPPLTLTLEQKGMNVGAAEFATYEVRDGYVKGVADGLFPFEGTITGTLDCSTKKFTGIFDGWYALAIDIGLDLNKGFFKGPVTGVYDSNKHELTLGTWDVKEYKGNPLPGFGVVLTELGGGGQWDAKYKGPAADAGAAVVDAGSSVYDAGAPVPPVDAGPLWYDAGP